LAAALCFAHRFRTASWIALLPAALSFRFGLAWTDFDLAAAPPFTFAHRRRCAAAILALAAALMRLRRLPFFGAAAV
jgi:hypothetical protein